MQALVAKKACIRVYACQYSKMMNSKRAYAFIRQKILDGEFKPGDFLSAQSLSGEVGVSRTPVREALLQLENDGLVEITPRLGAVVKSMDYQEFKNLSEMRLAFETFAAGLAAERRTREDLEAMETSLATMRDLARETTQESDDEQWAVLGREDIRFHMAVIEAGRNELLLEQILRFQVIHRVVSLAGPLTLALKRQRNDPIDVWESHLRIFEAIRNENQDSAIAAMRDHLQQALELQLKKMKSLGGTGTRGSRMSRKGLIYSDMEA